MNRSTDTREKRVTNMSGIVIGGGGIAAAIAFVAYGMFWMP